MNQNLTSDPGSNPAASKAVDIDALTGLPNRKLLFDRLTMAIDQARQERSSLALLFLDINGFKQINDMHGHAVADDVLKQVAKCLTESISEADLVSRRGGDEFVIMLNNVTQAADAALIAEKVIGALARVTRIGRHVFRLTTSIGISVFPEDGEDADTLIDRADAAMYLAKRRGLGHYFFNSALLDKGDHPYAPPAPPTSATTEPFSRTDQELLNTQMREANAQLMIATIVAQEGQESAEYAQRRQTEFLAVLAHELCSPLTPIRLAVARMEHIPQTEFPRMQALIEREVFSISRLVSDLLDVARVSTGSMRIERRVTDLGKVIEASIDACRPAIDARQQLFTQRLPECVLTVRGDAIRLTQILRNLLDNASKYTPVGGRISFDAEVVQDAILIRITDNGIGIAAEMLPHIFDPFKQDTRAVGFNGVGLGIGLKVVHDLAEAHGGSIVASSPGVGLGSTFLFTLPQLHRASESSEGRGADFLLS